ncbi:aspartate ammonia-lyase [Microbacterium esteraromaticum]|uniref:Aspartate ammonia-lyase n=1 Tax=Microbacterium esteraromaticum TaxID=57043 RepID=A0A939IV93_9MICO|nr:aspartate ammonia-lyase [Microbacterium esteraromaticum]MBN8205854.1 aspartate ammonia-lyase [Microbacterium esteraromaticum]MBN8416009.1 aspartate ammonia-lyase [Microbacterium esteraromaticum]MCA1306015.1 aspartate ammonia-lyase [Microbacterium esteraromaticum]WDH79964.1 aspartate ammonia-lyase [Microbacterium esteraromaticum]
MAADAPAPTRTETDSLGSLEIPADAYWGVHTARAEENFPITKRPISVYPDMIRGLAMVKQASARANKQIGTLDAERADLIDAAAQRVIDGEFHDQFIVGVIQGGAGTSTNMNANEVITNIALEMAGRQKGDYAYLSPIDHTNRSQSTNDVYPTAIKIGLSLNLRSLLDELDLLRRSFLGKAAEFHDVLKVGRTQLQDAVPMTLGQEFNGFASTLGYDHKRLTENASLLFEINMGATAIGTGITTHPAYASAVLYHLREISGLDLKTADDLVESTSDTGSFMSFSSSLKRNAIKLSKICNDLRLLSSGPQAGLGEINLPAKQAGSSIMPGKVNPVIPEVVNQVAFAVAGADTTVTMAVEGGQLQLNAFEPVIAHSIFQSITWMQQAMWTLRVNCVDGITANRDRLGAMVGASVGVVTALTPFIGYAASAALAKTALLTNRNVADLVVEAGLMTREEVMKQISPARLSGLETVTAAIPVIAAEDLPEN